VAPGRESFGRCGLSRVFIGWRLVTKMKAVADAIACATFQLGGKFGVWRSGGIREDEFDLADVGGKAALKTCARRSAVFNAAYQRRPIATKASLQGSWEQRARPVRLPRGARARRRTGDPREPGIVRRGRALQGDADAPVRFRVGVATGMVIVGDPVARYYEPDGSALDGRDQGCERRQEPVICTASIKGSSHAGKHPDVDVGTRARARRGPTASRWGPENRPS
jgi:hypothetical protein